MPSHFWPQLKDMTPHLIYEGSASDLKLPDFTNNPEVKIDLSTLFKEIQSFANDEIAQSLGMFDRN